MAFVFGAAVRDLRRTGTAGVTAVLLCALAVVVAGATLLGLQALARLAAPWRADLRLVATLRDEPASRSRQETLAVGVRALPGVVAVRYVSPSEALADLRRFLGASGAGLDRLPTNPVPARLEVIPATTVGAAGLRDLVQSLERLPGVETVQGAFGWVEPFERVARGLRVGGLSLAGTLGLAALLAITGATRLARQRGADETAVLRLVGVAAARLRVPLVLQALVQGGAGAALGWGALLLLTEMAAPWLGEWLGTTLGWVPLPTPPWPLGLSFVGTGLTAGAMAGLAAGRP